MAVSLTLRAIELTLHWHLLQWCSKKIVETEFSGDSKVKKKIFLSIIWRIAEDEEKKVKLKI